MRERTRPPAHPGAIIKRHYLEPLDLTVSEVASGLRVSRKTLSKIVNERGAVTPDMALRLAKAFGTSPELWLNLQQNHALWRAAHGNQAWQRIRVLTMRGASSKTEYEVSASPMHVKDRASTRRRQAGRR